MAQEQQPTIARSDGSHHIQMHISQGHVKTTLNILRVLIIPSNYFSLQHTHIVSQLAQMSSVDADKDQAYLF